MEEGMPSEGKGKLVVQSRLWELAKKFEVNVAGEFSDAFDNEVEILIKKASERCKANGRKTIRPSDL